jgi:hypothetical protein
LTRAGLRDNFGAKDKNNYNLENKKHIYECLHSLTIEEI